MCGIAGIVELTGRPASKPALQELCRLLSHRGPDGSGYWSSDNHAVLLGHRRLAILDPDRRADQPMVSDDGRHIIVFNGEIYNFLELRQELEARGETFRTESDTEIILAAWRVWGEAALDRFNGMWAFALYDTESRALFLSRDRFGIKPLIYSCSKGRVVFASELLPLVASGLVDATVEPNVARRVLVDPFGIEGSDKTLFQSCRRLQPGHCMTIRNGRIVVRRWWTTTQQLPAVPKTSQDRAERFGELFREAVTIRMRSDVPIGTSLSGGFDSSAVLCTMAAIDQGGGAKREAPHWRHAFVASFPGLDNDELPYAQMAARWAGVTPTILGFGEEDALSDIQQALWSLDDVYIGLPTVIWQLYREMRRNEVLVSLDGHGADELMGGYRQAGKGLMFWLRNLLARFAAPGSTWAVQSDRARLLVLKQRHELFVRGEISRLPPPLSVSGERDVLPEQWGGMGRRLYRMFSGTVLPTILRNFDRLSMAHGVEVRMPFLDWRLVTYTMALPDESKNNGGFTKFVARQAMRGKMPEPIRTQRRKVGFNSPMPRWLNGPLRPWVDQLLAARVPEFEELVDEHALSEKVKVLAGSGAWTWESVGRIWPYLHLKWLLNRLSAAGAQGNNPHGA